MRFRTHISRGLLLITLVAGCAYFGLYLLLVMKETPTLPPPATSYPLVFGAPPPAPNSATKTTTTDRPQLTLDDNKLLIEAARRGLSGLAIELLEAGADIETRDKVRACGLWWKKSTFFDRSLIDICTIGWPHPPQPGLHERPHRCGEAPPCEGS